MILTTYYNRERGLYGKILINRVLISCREDRADSLSSSFSFCKLKLSLKLNYISSGSKICSLKLLSLGFKAIYISLEKSSVFTVLFRFVL